MENVHKDLRPGLIVQCTLHGDAPGSLYTISSNDLDIEVATASMRFVVAPRRIPRRLRLLFEDFPKNHNLILVAQPQLLSRLALTVNEDLRNRVTYSVTLHKLAPDVMADFIHAQIDRVALAHNTFTDDALALTVRSSEGILRSACNLCVASLLEAVRDRIKTVDLKQVNRVLLQPHWRRELDTPL